MSGKKNDQGKNRLDLVPVSAIHAMGRAFTYGADKYEDRNWEKGLEFGRLYGALQRHLTAWWDNIETDEESGLNHLDHAFACLAMLNEMQYSRPDLDTRSKLRKND